MSYSHGAVALVPVYLPPPVRLADPSNPTNAGMRLDQGQAVYENDNYKITMGDNDRVHINNKRTGETYEAWGDPHMNIDGKHSFDFWGRTTLKLDDGTSVDIHTTPMKDNPAATLSSRVVVTAPGGKTWETTGIDTNQRGDLSFRELDRHANRGFDLGLTPTNVLYENPNGQGFLAADQNGRLATVDQAHINRTDLVKGGAGTIANAAGGLKGDIGQLANRFGDAFGRCSGLQAMEFIGMMLGQLMRSAMEQPRNGMGFEDYFRRHQHAFQRGFDNGLEGGLGRGYDRGYDRGYEAGRRDAGGQQDGLMLMQLSLQRGVMFL